MGTKLTKQDLLNIGDLIDQKLDQKLKEELSPIKERIHLLPTKDEFFKKMDEVITELHTTREEQTVMHGQIANHEDRITFVEEKLLIASE